MPDKPDVDRAPKKRSKRGYLWVTLMFFVITLTGQWTFSWLVYVDEAQAHGQPIDGREYFNQTMKDMLENWQSEFLQLCWQVAGLAFLWYVGSPQSKEGDDRKEEKIDRLLEKAYGVEAAREIQAELSAKYPQR